MPHTYFLRGARQLITLRGPAGPRRGSDLRQLGIIVDGSVLIRDGCILSLGSTRRVENLRETRTALEIPAHDRIIMPGLVDAGVHLNLSSTRADGKPRRLPDLTEDVMALLHACLPHGTTAIRAYAHARGSDVSADLSVLRRLNKLDGHPVVVRSAWRFEPEISAEWNADPKMATALQVIRKKQLAHAIAVSSSADAACRPTLFEWARHTGLASDLIWQGGSLEHFKESLEALSPATVYVEGPSTEECGLLAAAPAITVVPVKRSLIELENKTPSLRPLVDSGGALALASGYHAAEAPNSNLQMVMSLAVIRLGLTIEEAVCALTVNAAHAAGWPDRGRIEAGKPADLVMLNVPHLEELPRQFAMNHVAMVFRKGALVVNRTRWRAPAEASNVGRVRSEPVGRP